MTFQISDTKCFTNEAVIKENRTTRLIVVKCVTHLHLVNYPSHNNNRLWVGFFVSRNFKFKFSFLELKSQIKKNLNV